MTSAVITGTKEAINALDLLNKLEGIKASATYCVAEAIAAHKTTSKKYPELLSVLQWERNHLNRIFREIDPPDPGETLLRMSFHRKV